MKGEPYARFKDEELILRDYLAVDRTVLANERTFLSYVRTALAFAGASVVLVHFFDSLAARVTGWTLIPLAAVTLAVGAQRYLHMRQRLNRIEHRANGKAAS